MGMHHAILMCVQTGEEQTANILQACESRCHNEVTNTTYTKELVSQSKPNLTQTTNLDHSVTNTTALILHLIVSEPDAIVED